MRHAYFFVSLLILSSLAPFAAASSRACSAASPDYWTCSFECHAGDAIVVHAQTTGDTPGDDYPRTHATCGGVDGYCQQNYACEQTIGIAQFDDVGVCHSETVWNDGGCAAIRQTAPPKCTSQDGVACDFSCKFGQTLYVEATGNGTVSGLATCGGVWSACDGDGACEGASASKTTDDEKFGTCKGSAGSRVTCSTQPNWFLNEHVGPDRLDVPVPVDVVPECVSFVVCEVGVRLGTIVVTGTGTPGVSLVAYAPDAHRQDPIPVNGGLATLCPDGCVAPDGSGHVGGHLIVDLRLGDASARATLPLP